jgi:hypothetical protein
MAIELTRWFRREAKRVYLISNQARRSDEEEKVYEYVASHQGASVRELQRNPLQGKSSGFVEEVVKHLVRQGRLEEVIQEREGKGRPTRTYKVS